MQMAKTEEELKQTSSELLTVFRRAWILWAHRLQNVEVFLSCGFIVPDTFQQRLQLVIKIIDRIQ
jgi:hypothetical protein